MTITLRTLSQGIYAIGEDVKTLQQLLNAKINTSLEPDGKFGPLTNTALKSIRLQAHLWLMVNVDLQTWSKAIGGCK